MLDIKLESFRKKRVKLSKISNGVSRSYRVGKGSMASGAKNSLLPKQRHEKFLRLHNL